MATVNIGGREFLTRNDGTIDWENVPEARQDYYKLYQKLVVRAWLDPAFEQQFRANPADVMRQNGIPVPQNLVIQADQFVLPPRPDGLRDEQLVPIGDPSQPNKAAITISCAGSASSFSCPGCTASTFGSGGCLVEEQPTE